MLQVDPENEQLMLQHVTCAALELPVLLQDDQAYFGPSLPSTAHHLRSLGMPYSPRRGTCSIPTQSAEGKQERHATLNAK